LEEYAASIFKVVRMLMDYIGVGRGLAMEHRKIDMSWEGNGDGAQSRPTGKEN
jgi:hypothetical protein